MNFSDNTTRISTAVSSADLLKLPSSFPQRNYTPFGYIDNPAHSVVANHSGIIRSVPPMGFGFWCRSLPWPYASTMTRPINYLSFLHLSVALDDSVLHTSQDFEKHGIQLCSRYHTKTMMSYDWEKDGLTFSAKYFLADEHSLVCIVEVANTRDTAADMTLHATNIYGFHERRWWGSSGVVAGHNKRTDTMVNKLWEYGDIFALGANHPSTAHKATSDEAEWNQWIYNTDSSSNDGASIEFGKHSHLYSLISYQLSVPAHSSASLVLSLTRDVNEQFTLRRFSRTIQTARDTLTSQLEEDESFYQTAPLLSGDWPEAWQQGWLYDFETLRMNVRRPCGIFTQPWDAMQIFMPRMVLGETTLDMMCLSYADSILAKKVIFGVFVNAPAPNIPCCREDGSMNMIDAGGAECGTSPVWGLPFHVIHSIYLRDHDDQWITQLYPYLKAFIDWWLENRTDAEGWFHCNNSWESGQDGSKRFTFNGCSEADVVDFVRTVDVEAAMANAMHTMVLFAGIAGHEEDRERWETMAQRRIETTREMFVDGWFRDVDARSHTPIILEDYYDIMMMLPVTLGIATPEQINELLPMFRYFREHPQHWLDWPSFMFPFTEAASNAGLQDFAADLVVETGDRIYSHSASPSVLPAPSVKTTLPDQYNYRIPGQACEFWPREPGQQLQNGSECYGWGATLPTLVIRNIFGFKESQNQNGDTFHLAPALPERLADKGSTFGIRNLHFKKCSFDLSCSLQADNTVQSILSLRAPEYVSVVVTGPDGAELARSTPGTSVEVSFSGKNGTVFTIQIC